MATKEVEFNKYNYDHCHCPVCPVQFGNDCVKAKREEFSDFDKASKDKEDVPRLYCSIGTSSCEGLKESRPCLCPSCLVWYKSKLEKTHFCTKGKEQNG